MKKLFLIIAALTFASTVNASDITWADKTTGGTFSAEDANEVKTAVNSKADVTELPTKATLGLDTTDNPSFNSVHASGGNLAAANAQVTKKWITAMPYTVDVTSVIHGGHHFICKASHTSGALDDEPGVGAVWTTYWKYAGEAIYEPVQTAASQAEMEAGTETAIRSMSPLRVKQAITANSTGTDDQTASEVAFTPNGSIAATDVQAAIQEVRDEAGSGHTEVTLSADLGNNLLGLSTQLLSLDNQNANIVFAGPATGAAAAPTFRSLVDADIPSAIARDSEIIAAPTDATITTTDVTTNNASTTKHGWALKATAPASGLINTIGIGNGETVYSMKPLFDATAPSTQAFGDSASAGTAIVTARRDHKHAMPAAQTPTSLNLLIGTNTQAYDADLDDLADGSLTGTKVGLTDTGNYFTTDNANAALQELGAKLPAGSDGTYGLTLTNNTSRTPTAATMEIYPEGGVWKMNNNGTEYTIPTSTGGMSTTDIDTSSELSTILTDENTASGGIVTNPMTTAGDMIVAAASGASTGRIAAVAAGQVLASAGTGTSPAYTANPYVTTIELGAATDTTLARSAAGSVTIEGNAIYRAAGTDVPVADGGTGRSTGSTAYALIATGTTATGAQQTLANGATTEILVGGGASALPVWTTATGTGAPVRGTSPTIATPAITTAEVNGASSATLTAAQVSSTIVYNTGQAASDIALTLPTAAAGYSSIFTVGTAQSNKWGVRSGTNDKIYLLAADGTISAGSDNGYARMTAAQIGQSFACWTFKTDAYDWMCKAVSIGTSTFAAN